MIKCQNCGRPLPETPNVCQCWQHEGPLPSSEVVRLVAPVAGQYCAFEAGELVKVKPSTRAGTLTVERATWRNALTISNVLAYVPNHLVCTEPNAKAMPTASTGATNT